MKRLIIYFLVLLASVWVGIKIHDNPGYVLITFQHWSIESTLWFTIIAIIVFLLLLTFLFRIIRGTAGLSGRFRFWSGRRRIQKARKRTSRGLCELAEGDWAMAEKTLIQGVEKSETPLINYLGAARAAQGQGAFERRDKYLQQAHQSTAGSEVAVGLTQAQLQLNSKQLEQALATLKHLTQLVPKHSYVLKLLKNAFLELKDWEELLQLMPELRKQKVMKTKELNEFEKMIHLELLATAAKAENQEALDQSWKQIPKPLRKQPDLVLAYTNYLIQRKQDAKAEELLRQTLKKEWYPQLVHQYGIALGPDMAKQLATAESWLTNHPKDPTLLLCLGRLCMRSRLWGKARSYLESSAKLDARPETFRELGKILEQLGDRHAALDCYRRGLSAQ